MPPLDSFGYDDRPVPLRGCDCPGCAAPGDYRAPKTRDLADYYWFCLDHVREYNRSWDYFAGMTGGEIEAYNRSATVWERPSWPMGDWRQREQTLRDEVMREFFADAGMQPPPPMPPMPKAESDALAMLELTPPVAFIEIKAQYKILVKRYHPDANNGSREAEEKFKSINQAFTVLRKIYESEDA